MLKIIKDIDICYDGIRLVKLKEGQDFDVKTLLPNPKKAKAFTDRLIDLKAAIQTAKEESKEAEKPVGAGEGKEKETAKDTFAEMKKKELQAFLDDAGVEYETDANKPRLVELARLVAVGSEMTE